MLKRPTWLCEYIVFTRFVEDSNPMNKEFVGGSNLTNKKFV